MSAEPRWDIAVHFTEEEDVTRAEALLNVEHLHLRGFGKAKRRSGDPTVPVIGEDLAAARALSDLSHQLLHAAAERIEGFEHRPVHLSH